MKKISLLSKILVLFFFIFSAGFIEVYAKDWNKITVGTEGNYPKFSYVDPAGNLKGWDIDIVTEVCKRMGAECKFVRTDFDGMISDVYQPYGYSFWLNNYTT
ncbi:hypothetical protein LCGC14_3056670, partial [marine sediment metagenome]